jgi:general secretion pathway protein D
MTRLSNWTIFLLVLSLPALSLTAQSIAEKKARLESRQSDLDQEMDEFLTQLNKETLEIRAQIKRLYDKVWNLYQSDAPPEEYQSLIDKIKQERAYLIKQENRWRELAASVNRTEGYGLWHAPDTYLEQLIIDYGAQDYVYLIPPEIGGIKISIDSNLPIPRASWDEMLELILNQNGVGIETLNPYLRQLYLIKENRSNLHLITNDREDLEVLPPTTRVAFMLSPEPSEVKRSVAFLENFINHNNTLLQVLGRDILLIGQVNELLDLLQLYDFVATNRGEKDFRLIPVFKAPAEEMARIVSAIFDQTEQPDGGGSPGARHAESNGLKMIVLESMSQALFLIGTREEVRKAEEIIRDVESQIGGARDKTVYWYSVRHSDAEELADVLYRIYTLMVGSGTGYDYVPSGGGYGPGGPGGPGFFNGPGGGMMQQGGPMQGGPGGPPGQDGNRVVVVENQNPPPPPPMPPPQKEPPLLLYGQEGYYQEGGYVVNPAPAQPRVFTETEANTDRENFIVDIKTGSIVMVVEQDLLPKIKELIRKLDVPKKMVHIETLLFEKFLHRETNYGLNLLRIGNVASNTHFTGLDFNNIFPIGSNSGVPNNAGVTDFFMSRKKSCSGAPAFDMIYRFLLNQDDVQINSSPSILTMNQTPASISINEDISINTGIFEVETAKGVTLKDSFTRAQYGITISVKPTIHDRDCDDLDSDTVGYDYVTLETDITFDTFQPSSNPSRPNVTRRHITNQVQVVDGESIVLGGLRRKITTDNRDSIPFIGELPGIGKLFSINSLEDSSTEMFICLTPHIIKDPKEQLTCLRQELLCVRPGDIPYFLECVQEAFEYEKNLLMEGSMTMLFGRPQERFYLLDCCTSDDCGQYDGEYDGR